MSGPSSWSSNAGSYDQAFPILLSMNTAVHLRAVMHAIVHLASDHQPWSASYLSALPLQLPSQRCLDQQPISQASFISIGRSYSRHNPKFFIPGHINGTRTEYASKVEFICHYLLPSAETKPKRRMLQSHTHLLHFTSLSPQECACLKTPRLGRAYQASHNLRLPAPKDKHARLPPFLYMPCLVLLLFFCVLSIFVPCPASTYKSETSCTVTSATYSAHPIPSSRFQPARSDANPIN